LAGEPCHLLAHAIAGKRPVQVRPGFSPLDRGAQAPVTRDRAVRVSPL